VKTKLLILFVPLIAALCFVTLLANRGVGLTTKLTWSEEERAILETLWLRNLPPLPESPSNHVADNPEAATLGHRLFFDTRLSKNYSVACATCHQPQRLFTDGLTLAQGQQIGTRNTQSIVGAAYSPWYFWDGRKDSLWSQALAPLENKLEHGGNRYRYATLLSLDNKYRDLYEKIFGEFPDIKDDQTITEVFVNMGKSLAAYQRLLIPGESRFDRYIEQVVVGTEFPSEATLNAQEVEGLRLFIGKAQCTNCHNGPLLSNFSFHNTGIFPLRGSTPDLGRIEGAQLAKEDPFNCLGEFSDDVKHRCDELIYMKEDDDLIGAQKTPSLRAINGTEPYMHAGQFNSLSEVLQHYNTAEGALIGHNEAKPLNLNQTQLQALEAFLKSLSAPLNVEEKWLLPPADMPLENSRVTLHSNAY